MDKFCSKFLQHRCYVLVLNQEPAHFQKGIKSPQISLDNSPWRTIITQLPYKFWARSRSAGGSRGRLSTAYWRHAKYHPIFHSYVSRSPQGMRGGQIPHLFHSRVVEVDYQIPPLSMSSASSANPILYHTLLHCLHRLSHNLHSRAIIRVSSSCRENDDFKLIWLRYLLIV